MVEAKIVALFAVVLNICRGNGGMEIEIRFLHFTKTSKMLTPVNCDKIQNVIPGTATTKAT